VESVTDCLAQLNRLGPPKSRASCRRLRWCDSENSAGPGPSLRAHARNRPSGAPQDATPLLHGQGLRLPRKRLQRLELDGAAMATKAQEPGGRPGGELALEHTAITTNTSIGWGKFIEGPRCRPTPGAGHLENEPSCGANHGSTQGQTGELGASSLFQPERLGDQQAHASAPPPTMLAW